MWALIGTYDTVLSQFVPDDTAEKLPKTWQVAVMTGDLLPWWGWLLVLAAIVIVGLLEELSRLTKAPNPVAASSQAGTQGATTFSDAAEQFRADLAHKAYLNRLALTGGVSPLQRGYNRAKFQQNPNEKAAILRLTQLRDEGVVIRNDAVSGKVNAETLEQWLNDVARWMRDVIEALKRVDEAKAEYFKTLDIVENARVQAPVLIQNRVDIRRFVNGFNQHDQRLVCLRDILKPYIFN